MARESTHDTNARQEGTGSVTRQQADPTGRQQGESPGRSETHARRESTLRSGATSREPDRERSIATTRDRGRAAAGGELSRRRDSSPAEWGSLGSGHPLQLMQRMASDMDRLFEQFGLGPTGLQLAPLIGAGPGTLGDRSGLAGSDWTGWRPQLEVFERGDDLVIRADVPGVKKDDLHLDIEGDTLVIRGERREEREEDEEGFFRTERSYGEFRRQVALPEGVDTDRCEATFRDGVLEVTLGAPRREARKGKRIEIR